MEWNHFTKNNDPKISRASCNYCGKSYACQTKRSDTSTLRAHLENQCKKYPLRVNKDKQKLLAFSLQKQTDGEGKFITSSVKNHVYNYESCRKVLAKMVICDELSFRFVEGEGFRNFCQNLEPRFTIPSRVTIAKDCMKIYEEEKDKLKEMMKGRRVCLTTDTWTSIQNINYMCLTAHWIDSEWKIHKRIINMIQVANHKGEMIGKCIKSCMLSWGIDRILTVTVDNASANDLAIANIKKISKR